MPLTDPFLFYVVLEDLLMIFGTIFLFGLCWFILNYFFSLGGWIKLQANYLANNNSPSTKLRIQTSGVVGTTPYKKSLYVSPLENGLWLSAGAISSPFHKPLLIPWREVDIRIVKVRFVYFAVFTVDDIQISFFASAWNQVQRVRKYINSSKQPKRSKIADLLAEATASQRGPAAKPAKETTKKQPAAESKSKNGPAIKPANRPSTTSAKGLTIKDQKRPRIRSSNRPVIRSSSGPAINPSKDVSIGAANRPSIKRIPVTRPSR